MNPAIRSVAKTECGSAFDPSLGGLVEQGARHRHPVDQPIGASKKLGRSETCDTQQRAQRDDQEDRCEDVEDVCHLHGCVKVNNWKPWRATIGRLMGLASIVRKR